MRLPVAFVALLLLAGCDLFGESRPERVRARPVVTSSTAEGLADARGRWAEADLDDYQLEYTRACECLRAAAGPFLVTVEGGAVTEVEPLSGEPLPDGYEPFTVVRLFDAIDEAFDEGADAVDVVYDAALGFPVRIAIDYDARVADEELYLEVTGFERLDG
ncbi:MAG: DUF6174 domain-containing protein [Rubricoccaceae bacterium]|nr:DUF6174 domain-containing protein [Rubricoccaceae bacterium]